jgi:phage tail-like protein
MSALIKEGGRNYGPAQRVGPVTFSTVILKRGMTETGHLWQWWQLVASGKYAYRLRAEITMLRHDARLPEDSPPGSAIIFSLDKALPIKFKAADLNALGGNTIAIEELHLAHEGLRCAWAPAPPRSG